MFYCAAQAVSGLAGAYLQPPTLDLVPGPRQSHPRHNLMHTLSNLAPSILRDSRLPPSLLLQHAPQNRPIQTADQSAPREQPHEPAVQEARTPQTLPSESEQSALTDSSSQLLHIHIQPLPVHVPALPVPTSVTVPEPVPGPVPTSTPVPASAPVHAPGPVPTSATVPAPQSPPHAPPPPPTDSTILAKQPSPDVTPPANPTQLAPPPELASSHTARAARCSNTPRPTPPMHPSTPDAAPHSGPIHTQAPPANGASTDHSGPVAGLNSITAGAPHQLVDAGRVSSEAPQRRCLESRQQRKQLECTDQTKSSRGGKQSFESRLSCRQLPCVFENHSTNSRSHGHASSSEDSHNSMCHSHSPQTFKQRKDGPYNDPGAAPPLHGDIDGPRHKSAPPQHGQGLGQAPSWTWTASPEHSALRSFASSGAQSRQGNAPPPYGQNSGSQSRHGYAPPLYGQNLGNSPPPYGQNLGNCPPPYGHNLGNSPPPYGQNLGNCPAPYGQNLGTSSPLHAQQSAPDYSSSASSMASIPSPSIASSSSAAPRNTYTLRSRHHQQRHDTDDAPHVPVCGFVSHAKDVSDPQQVDPWPNNSSDTFTRRSNSNSSQSMPPESCNCVNNGNGVVYVMLTSEQPSAADTFSIVLDYSNSVCML